MDLNLRIYSDALEINLFVSSDTESSDFGEALMSSFLKKRKRAG
jgi:hypothetical protein